MLVYTCVYVQICTYSYLCVSQFSLCMLLAHASFSRPVLTDSHQHIVEYCSPCSLPQSLTFACVHTTQHIAEDPAGCFPHTRTLMHARFAIVLCMNTDTLGSLPLPATHTSRLPGVSFTHTKGYLPPLHHKAIFFQSPLSHASCGSLRHTHTDPNSHLLPLWVWLSCTHTPQDHPLHGMSVRRSAASCFWHM